MTEQTQAPAGPLISDDEIREWARTTGRPTGQRGRVPNALRKEYETIAGELAGPPAAAPADVPAGGAESHAETPEPARAEQRPRKVQPKRGQGAGARLRALLGAAPPAKSGSRARAAKPKADAPPRQPITEIVASGWDRVGRWVAKVNAPVGRCLSWQADYAGMVAEEVIPNTPVDRVLQVAQRARGKYAAAGAVVATPIIVYLLEQPGNQPVDETGAPSAAGMAKHELLMEGLEDCLRLQLKYLGGEGRAEKLAQQQADRAAAQEEVDRILALFFSEPPDPGSAEAAAQQAAAEQAQQAQAAANAVRLMAPAPVAFTAPSGLPVIRDGQQVGVTPDLRGTAAPVPPVGARPVRQRVRDDGRLEPDRTL